MTAEEKELAIRCAVITGLIARGWVSPDERLSDTAVESVACLTRLLLNDALQRPLT